MKVVIDTSAWSLALRRSAASRERIAAEVGELALEGRAVLLGIVRQEVLSGIPDAGRFNELKERLRAFPDLELEASDYETGAAYFNQCRAKGIQGSAVDFLICAAATRRNLPILAADADFARYARVLPLRLYEPRR